MRDHWGSGSGYTERDAIDRARIDGVDRCERDRDGNSLLMCTVVDSECTATPG